MGCGFVNGGCAPSEEYKLVKYTALTVSHLVVIHCSQRTLGSDVRVQTVQNTPLDLLRAIIFR